MNPKSFKYLSKDGLTLSGRGWVAPTVNPQGIVHLVHGLGEHSGRYDHVGNKFAKAGYHLIGFDLRGHGLSEGRRGHSPSISHLMEDIQALIDESTKYLGNSLPRFFYGHGFGGNLVIHFGMQRSSNFKGFIVTSPAFSTTRPQKQLKLTMAKFIAKLLPGIRLKNEINPEALSRNTAIVQTYRKDVYVQNKVSARLGLDLLESGQLALENAKGWDSPMLLMHGSADHITAYPASEKFARHAAGQVEFVRWDGYYHELHHDLGHEAVIEKMIQWLDQQIN
jgi:alpha-beta hydrolase superfamily lysophospholipase